MNPRIILLAFCLVGNALLAIAVFRHPFLPQNSDSPKIPAKKITLASETNAPVAPALPAASDFDWSQLTDPDWAVYVARLRAFGTPEQQVRDIIYGAVDATYRPRRAALRSSKKPDDGKYWERQNFFSPSFQMTKEQRAQMRALQKEEHDLLVSVLGDDFYEQMIKDSGNDWMEKQYGFLPKELREKVQEIETQMNDEKQEIYAKNQGYMDQYSQADLRKIEKKYHDQLAAILTPEQLFEWDLRHSDTANQLKNNLSAFDPDEDEFRALFKYQQAKDDLTAQSNPQQLDPDADPVQLTADEKKSLQDQQKALDAELAQSLGTNRVAEYKLEQDYSYRNLIDAGVPKDSVFKLDDIKKQAQDAANKIRRDQTLTPDQRTEALNAIRTEAQNSINDLLGAKSAKIYSNNGGWWINNIAPPPPKSP